MNYIAYVHKAGDGKRVAYAFLIQGASTGKYTEHLIVMRKKEANDFRAFQQILRTIADKPNVHRVNIVVNNTLAPVVFQLTGAEQPENVELAESTKWLMRRFYSCNFEGGNGDEPQEVAVIDAANEALERRNTIFKRIKNVMGEIFYGTKKIG